MMIFFYNSHYEKYKSDLTKTYHFWIISSYSFGAMVTCNAHLRMHCKVATSSKKFNSCYVSKYECWSCRRIFSETLKIIAFGKTKPMLSDMSEQSDTKQMSVYLL